MIDEYSYGRFPMTVEEQQEIKKNAYKYVNENYEPQSVSETAGETIRRTKFRMNFEYIPVRTIDQKTAFTKSACDEM